MKTENTHHKDDLKTLRPVIDKFAMMFQVGIAGAVSFLAGLSRSGFSVRLFLFQFLVMLGVFVLYQVYRYKAIDLSPDKYVYKGAFSKDTVCFDEVRGVILKEYKTPYNGELNLVLYADQKHHIDHIDQYSFEDLCTFFSALSGRKPRLKSQLGAIKRHLELVALKNSEDTMFKKRKVF